MKLAIHVNLNRDIDGRQSKRLIEQLRQRGIDYRLIERDPDIYRGEEYYTREEALENADVLLVFGGDGTVLGVAVDCAKKEIPIMAVNVGNLGFLSQLSPDEMSGSLDKLLNGSFATETREIIEVDAEGRKFYALNEAILCRDSASHIIKVEIKIDGSVADNLRADGVMLATPTGSTAYSMSCGGPILSPNVEAFVINSICPHTLHSRPIVVSSASTVEFTADTSEMSLLTIDGNVEASFTGKVTVKLRKSELVVKFIKVSNDNFYNRLLSKLNTWNI